MIYCNAYTKKTQNGHHLYNKDEAAVKTKQSDKFADKKTDNLITERKSHKNATLYKSKAN